MPRYRRWKRQAKPYTLIDFIISRFMPGEVVEKTYYKNGVLHHMTQITKKK